MNSKEKGDSVVGEAIAYFIRKGCEVLLPIGDKKPYDLVVDDGGTLKKIQCKYTSCRKESGAFEASLRITGGNQSFHTVKRYKPGDFDLLFVMTADRQVFVIPSSETDKLTATITLGEKYIDYRVQTAVAA